jgi:CelD/BcsL family acetyltransferase involved in cellulose biosynthesis
MTHDNQKTSRAAGLLDALSRAYRLLKQTQFWNAICSPSLTHSIVRDDTRFAELQGEWEELFRRASVQTPFLRYSWLRLCWQRQRASGRKRLFIFVIRKNGSPVLIAPFSIRPRSGSWQLEFLDSLTPQYNDVLVERSPDVDTYIEYLWARLLDQPKIHRFVSKWVRNDSPIARPLATAQQLSKPKHESAPYIDFSVFNDWEDFLRTLPGTLRRKHRRQWQNLQSHGAVLRVADLATFEPDIAWLFREKRNWVDRRHERFTWLKEPDTEELFTAAAREGISSGAAWLTSLSVSGHTISVMLAFREGSTLYGSKLAYDPAWHRQSPGRTLLLLSLERAFQEGVRKCDLMLGRSYLKDCLSTGEIKVRTRRVSLQH